MPTTFSIAEQQQNNTITPQLLREQTLSEQEVERICKAFIRLIVAKESNHDEQTKPSKRKPHLSETDSTRTK